MVTKQDCFKTEKKKKPEKIILLSISVVWKETFVHNTYFNCPFHVGLLNQTLTSDHAKIRKKFALHPVDLKLGRMIGYEISQSLAEFRYAGLNM